MCSLSGQAYFFQPVPFLLVKVQQYQRRSAGVQETEQQKGKKSLKGHLI